MVAVTLSFFILLAISFFFLVASQRRQLIKNEQESVNHLSNTVLGSMEYSMLNNLKDEVREIVRTVARQEGIVRLHILDREGSIKISSEKDVGEKSDLTDPTCQLCHEDLESAMNKTVIFDDSLGQKVLRNVNPIYNEQGCVSCHPADQKIIGAIIMDVSVERIEKQIAINLRGMIIAALVMFAFLIASIYIVLARFVTNPLMDIVKGTQEIADGNLDFHINGDSRDEIGKLIHSFNAMTKDLKNSRNEVIRRVVELEKKNIEVSTMYNVVRSLTSTIDIEQVKEIVLSTILEILDADTCYLVLFDETEDRASISIKGKDSSEIMLEEIDSFGENERNEAFLNPAGSKLKSHLPFILDKEKGKIKTDYLFASLKMQNDKLGLIFAVRHGGDLFLESDSAIFLTLSRNLAMSIRHASLYKLAITDSLTNLYIKRYFVDRLEKEVKRTKRYRSDLSLMIMDFDEFKKINDNYGHPVGDVVLKRVAVTIMENIRTTDIAARYGGDEFAIILPETNEESAKIVAEKIQRSLEKSPVDISSGLKVTVMVSIGIAVLQNPYEGAQDLIEAADEAMYKVKRERHRNLIK